MREGQELKQELRELVTLIENLNQKQADSLSRHEENVVVAHNAGIVRDA